MGVTLTRTSDLDKLAEFSSALADKAHDHMVSCSKIYARVQGKNRTLHPDVPTNTEVSALINFRMARVRYFACKDQYETVKSVIESEKNK